MLCFIIPSILIAQVLKWHFQRCEKGYKTWAPIISQWSYSIADVQFTWEQIGSSVGTNYFHKLQVIFLMSSARVAPEPLRERELKWNTSVAPLAQKFDFVHPDVVFSVGKTLCHSSTLLVHLWLLYVFGDFWDHYRPAGRPESNFWLEKL